MSAKAVEHLAALSRLAAAAADALADPVATYASWVADTLAHGHMLLIAGNGGSAAHAQHVAAEYVVRYRANRRAARAIALSVDTSALTAAGNDLGFEQVFARQVEALGSRGDLLVLVSTSGNSANLVRAAETAKAKGLRTVGLLGGNGGRLGELVDLAVVVPSSDTALIQEIQLAIDHHVCSIVEPQLK